MWKGIFPAVTAKFTADGELDHTEMGESSQRTPVLANTKCSVIQNLGL
jgi:hypothetical protein